MPFRDLREFIKQLRAKGELAEIPAEVDWRYEIGGIVRKNLGQQGPALLFKNIKDYSTPLFTCGVSTYSRVSLALGLPPHEPLEGIISEFRKKINVPIKPRKSATGACKENILVGDQVNLLRFPVPLWQAGDGGRYIGTWHGVITQDPETGWTNAGMYRVMIHDEKTLGILIARDQHIGLHYEKYRKMKKAMPVAIVIGMAPLLPFIFLTPLPSQTDEYDYAGGLSGEAVELVKCETNDLEVPAYSEIVIEGEIPPEERRTEGPFGEWTGHYGGKSSPRPVIHVQCVTHRNDPIFRGTLEGKPVNEDHLCASVALSALAHIFLEETLGIAGIRGVHYPAVSGGWGMAVVSVNQRYPAHSRTIAHGLLGSKLGAFLKNVIIVDEDVDPFNLDEIWWSMVSRLQASRGVTILQRGKGAFMDPSQLPELQGFGDSFIVEAVKPYEWQPRPEWGNKRFPPVAYPSQETMKAVEKRWSSFGIPSKKEKK
ncbi:MAG: UbiD family decarboxylase [Deltaproteobacteria bacterium]|nr:UbiD family decarboxylase [Deltaproteobacteria bacterium]